MDKSALIAELLKKKGIRPAASQDILKRQSIGPCALSFSQQRLWYLDQLAPAQSVYNLPAAFRLQGHLKTENLFNSIRQVIKRHDSLRTRFQMIDNQPMQIVLEDVELELSIKEFEYSNTPDREQRLQDYISLIASEPFDLQQDLLIRVQVLKLADEEHVLFLMTHHTVSDGTSMTILINEIAQTYDRINHDPEYINSELEIQYTDYSQWQSDFLAGDELERQMDYWRNIFRSQVPTLNMTTDFPRPATQSYAGATLHFELDSQLTEKISQFARSCDTSAYTILLTALNILMSSYTGQNDIVIGTLISNRPTHQLDSLIGFFANTLAIRTQIQHQSSVKELVAKVRNSILDAHQHQSLPFEKLVAELDIERDFSRTPLFQILMGFQQTSDRKVVTDRLVFTPQLIPVDSSKTDIAFFFSQDSKQISLELTYCTALFEQESVTRLYGNLLVVLESMIDGSDSAIKDVSVISEFDHQTCLSMENLQPQVVGICTQDMFNLAFKYFADNTAVKCFDEELSYSQLDQLSNQLARYLIQHGTSQGEIIGLCTGRGTNTLLAILSIFKAGCAYLPLDPEFPQERLDFMIEDSGIHRMLSESQCLFNKGNVATIVIDEEMESIKQLSSEPVNSVWDENDVAYVIYTSGSTGKPKGVEIQHFALVNFLQQMAKRPGITSDDNVLAITTFSFDISILEMMLPLTVGACCIVAHEDAVNDGKVLIELLDKADISLMQATPSMWRLLLISGWQGRVNLKALSGGEALPAELAAKLKPKVASLWNMYGPTETTIWSTCHEIDEIGHSISIGRAIENTQLYCLDSLLRPTPVGVAGELYIGGKGVAKGYLNRPELTKQRFVDDLLIAGERKRAYRTGDEVRFCNDGRLQYLGRLDTQVKLRGYRIELGEIENVLAKHNAITQSAARVFKAFENDLRLVAYFVLGDKQEAPTNTELRQFLSQYLPDYMIPQFFVFLDELPKTANGKTDRLALPDPQSGSSRKDDEYIAPQTTMELLVAQHWTEALGGENAIATTDNFFFIGGHSMLAVMVLAKIEQQTAVHISPMLMATGTLGQIAKEIENKQLAIKTKAATERKTSGLLTEISRLFKRK